MRNPAVVPFFDESPAAFSCHRGAESRPWVALRIAVSMLVTFGLLILFACVAHAQAVAVAASAPSLNPDAVALLTWMGLSKYVAGIASLVFVGGFVVTHIMPWLPVPPANTTSRWLGLYAAAYALLNFIAGNYGKALNASAPAAAPAPSVKAGVLVLLLPALALTLLLSACASNGTLTPQGQAAVAAATPVAQVAVNAVASASPNAPTVVNAVIADGQEFCQAATSLGPVVVALINAADSKAVTVTGVASNAVAAACPVVNGVKAVPVPPPPAGTPVTVVAVTPPTS